MLVTASISHAHHISGTIYCDTDYDGNIDGGDSKIANVVFKAVSVDVNPGETFMDTSDSNGFYSIGLPGRTDRYNVFPTGLSGSWTIVLPVGGSYTIQIVTGDSSTDHKDNVDFLVQGCAPPPTTSTSTTSSSTSTTKKPTTSSTSSSTSTSTAAPSTTTIPGQCNCDLAFFVGRDAKYNNDAEVAANVVVNAPDGRLRLGKNVFMPDGTSIKGNAVEVGNASNIYRVFAKSLKTGAEVNIRAGAGGVFTLPVATPFCVIPSFTCGGDQVDVLPGEEKDLAPGTYGLVRVMNGATLRLDAGTYTICDLRIGRDARVEAADAVTLHVDGNLRIGTDSYFGPVNGAPIIDTYVTGRTVRVSQKAVAVARIIAPNARAAFGRDAALDGCYCSDRSKSDKHITLTCRVQ
jgi:hypothetical protein